MNKTCIVGKMILPSGLHPSVVLQPCKESLNPPSLLVSSKDSTILRFRLYTIRLMRSNKLNISCLFQSFIQRVTIIRFITNEFLRSFFYKRAIQCLLNKSYFMWASTCRGYRDRKSCALTDTHDLCALSAFSLPNARPPFLADANVPSMKHSLTSMPPRSFKSLAKAWSIFSNVPSFTHFWNLLWQVWYGGYLYGSSLHCAPVLSIHKTPFNTSLGYLGGRPFPLGFSSLSEKYCLIISHCSFVNSIFSIFKNKMVKSKHGGFHF